MIDVKPRLVVALLASIALDGCDRSPTLQATPPTKPERPPRFVQVKRVIQSVQPRSAATTSPSGAIEWDTVDLDVPQDVRHQFTRMTGHPFPDVQVQLTGLSGRPKLVAVGPTTSRVVGAETYKLVLKEMSQERRKGKRGFSGWIILKATDMEYATFFISSWPDPRPATTPDEAPTPMDASIPVEITWSGPHARDKLGRQAGPATQRATPDRTPPAASSDAPSPST
ncbi:MAG: hypothetical protein WBD40_24575 [Tepidisphaeraceae bacterium]